MAQSKITYNGVTLTYVGSKTLATAGKVMTTDMTIEPVVLSEAKTAYAVTTTATVVTPSAGKDALSQVTIGKITSTNLTAANIKAGTTVTVNNGNANIYSINGTFTSDANATASDILEGKTAYVNGSKVTGSLSTGSYKEEIGAPGAGEIGMTYSVAGDTVTVYVQNKAAFFAEGSCTYVIPDILPDFPDKDAQAAYILTGYQAYSETGSSIVGTMVDNSGGDTKTVGLVISNAAGTTPVTGYYKSGSQVSATPGTVVSSAATITTASVAWNATNSNWDVTGSKAISAPSVSKTGYISGTVGTKTGSTAYLSATLPVVAIQASATAASLNPALSRITKPAAQTWVDAAAGAAVTTTTASIVYVGVNMAAATVTPTIAATVTTAGYGTTAHYSASTSQAKVDVAAKNVYVPVITSTYTVGKTVSASASIANPAWSATDGKFNVVATATGTASATATVSTAGWIAAGSVTSAAASATNTATLALNKIAISSSLASGTKQPSIATATMDSGLTNAASGAAVITKPSSGVFVKVKSASNTFTLTATATVSTAGYGTTATFSTTNATATAGASASADTWVPIKTSTLTVGGSAAIQSIGFDNPAYDSTAGNFKVTATASGVSAGAATVSTAGWIAAGTYNGETTDISEVSTLTLAKLGTGATVTGTATYKPSIATGTVPSGVTNAASGAATTTAPTQGVYVRVNSAAATGTLTSKGTVVTPGYGTASTYTQGSTTTTVGAQASDLTYIPITTKTLANPTQAASVVTNSSATTPTIASGQTTNAALRITATETQTAGWTSGTKTGTFDIPIYIEDFHA